MTDYETAEDIVHQFPEELTSYNAYDSWFSYESTISKESKHSYLPPPDVVRQRALVQRWLVQMNFDIKIQDAVMLHDSPHIYKVIKMVTMYGVRETERRLLRFLCDESEEV